jgi:hypothetical protein
MKYLINSRVCWADECDVYFIEVLSEDAKRVYMAAKKVWGDWYDTLYFGTNEGWEDFDYLDFDLIELSDEEANVLQKYNIEAETIFDRFMEHLWDELVDLEFISDDDDIDFLYDMSEDELIEYFTKVREAAE